MEDFLHVLMNSKGVLPLLEGLRSGVDVTIGPLPGQSPHRQGRATREHRFVRAGCDEITTCMMNLHSRPATRVEAVGVLGLPSEAGLSLPIPLISLYVVATRWLCHGRSSLGLDARSVNQFLSLFWYPEAARMPLL